MPPQKVLSGQQPQSAVWIDADAETTFRADEAFLLCFSTNNSANSSVAQAAAMVFCGPKFCY
jgi:hypothetical protein